MQVCVVSVIAAARYAWVALSIESVLDGSLLFAVLFQSLSVFSVKIKEYKRIENINVKSLIAVHAMSRSVSMIKYMQLV